MTYTRPEGPPSRLYHGTTAEVDEFAPGSHFGTAEAANRRLADNAPNAEGARVYAVDAPQGNYVRVTDAGDAWNRADYWLEMARNRSPRNDAEANLFNAIRRDQDLRGLRDEALYARLDQHFRDNGFSGAIYANRWEGGESVFLPGRLSPRTAPDGGPVQAGFNLEVGSRGERTYTAPLNESFDLEVLVGSADERSVVHWGVIPRKNNARTDNLNQTARSRLATRSMREIERILASDAAQFQPRAYHFLPKPEQRAIIESMSRRLREAGYAPNHPNEYAMQFDRTGPNAGPALRALRDRT